MPSSRLSFGRLAAISILFIASINQVSALTMAYCSSENTASTSKNSSIFQSNGLCYNFCIDDYAFSVLQDDGCWCSNYAPADTVSTSKCSEECPGYLSDTCGGSGLFGYIALTKAASGTEGAASSTAAAASQGTVAPVTVLASTPHTTITETPTAVTVVVTPVQASSSSPDPAPDPETSSSLTTSTTTRITSTTSSTPTTITATSGSDHTTATSTTSSIWTPTPVTSLETVTGQVRTVTVTPTVPPGASSSSGSKKKSDGLSTGGAVGLTIGLVSLVALISGIVYFYLRKKKEEEAAKVSDESSAERRDSGGTNGGGVSRTMSENSRYVLGTDGRGQIIETWEPDAPGSRRSRLVPIDPRLNPHTGLYQGENKSRESVNTIRDDHDYSRKVHQPKTILRVSNPDTDDED